MTTPWQVFLIREGHDNRHVTVAHLGALLEEPLDYGRAGFFSNVYAVREVHHEYPNDVYSGWAVAEFKELRRMCAMRRQFDPTRLPL